MFLWSNPIHNFSSPFTFVASSCCNGTPECTRRQLQTGIEFRRLGPLGFSGAGLSFGRTCCSKRAFGGHGILPKSEKKSCLLASHLQIIPPSDDDGKRRGHESCINLKTAKALGLDVSLSVQQRTDEMYLLTPDKFRGSKYFRCRSQAATRDHHTVSWIYFFGRHFLPRSLNRTCCRHETAADRKTRSWCHPCTAGMPANHARDFPACTSPSGPREGSPHVPSRGFFVRG